MLRIRVHASLNSYLPGDMRGKYLEASPGEAEDLEKILMMLGIPEEAVAFAVVNGAAVGQRDRRNFVLSDGDEVQLFPVISGG